MCQVYKVVLIIRVMCSCAIITKKCVPYYFVFDRCLGLFKLLGIHYALSRRLCENIVSERGAVCMFSVLVRVPYFIIEYQIWDLRCCKCDHGFISYVCSIIRMRVCLELEQNYARKQLAVETPKASKSQDENTRILDRLLCACVVSYKLTCYVMRFGAIFPIKILYRSLLVSLKQAKAFEDFCIYAAAVLVFGYLCIQSCPFRDPFAGVLCSVVFWCVWFFGECRRILLSCCCRSCLLPLPVCRCVSSFMTLSTYLQRFTSLTLFFS